MPTVSRKYVPYKATQRSVDTALVTDIITLALLYFREVFFSPSNDINEPKTWAITHTHKALRFVFKFNIVGGLHAQTMPANFFMQDMNFDNGTKVWLPPAVGVYHAVGKYDRVADKWNIEMHGPEV